MKHKIFAGTYEPAIRAGVHVLEFDSANGAIVHKASLKGIERAGFLALHPSRRWLYATSEVHDGSVVAVDLFGGGMQIMNSQPSGGADPCHLSIDATGKWLFVANYTGGSIAMMPIHENGALEPMSDFVQHTGHGPNPDRQEKAHAHSITIDRSNRFAIVADLGQDQVFVYSIDLVAGKLKLHGAAHLAPGSGPRHVAFHTSHKWLYVCNELGNTVTQLLWNATDGTLSVVNSWPSLPESWHGSSTMADIHIAPNGTWLAASNRGHDSIVLFHIDAVTGALTPNGTVPSGGAVPRNFAIDPSGAWVLAGNQRSDLIQVFSAAGGNLAMTNNHIGVPSPVCILVD